MNHARVVGILAAALMLVSCQTIVEDLPASTVLPSSAPVPIVVITMPQVLPTVAPVVTGGGAPYPTQVPPGQQPQPTSPPSSGGGGGGGNPQGCTGDHGNCNPIASVHAYVFFLICNGVVVDGKFATEGPGDCDVRLDATAKDTNGKATGAQGTPEWRIDGSSWYVAGNPYTPTVRGNRGGFTATVTIDGVTSNTINYTFK